MAAPGRRTTLALGIVTGLLTIASSGSPPEVVPTPQPRAGAGQAEDEKVFKTYELVSTFKTLMSRDCLTPDFDFSDFVEVPKKCAQKVTVNDGSITGCGSAPVTALFYNCLSNSGGLVNAEGTFFNMTGFDVEIDIYTSDADWTSNAKQLLANCYRASAADLKPRQQAVFTYTCWKWSLFTDCDQQEERRGALSEAALLRRARFLSGSCPLSPIQLLDAFGVVTGRTWAECSAPLDTGADVQQQYDAEVSRVACLLKDFTTAAGYIDFSLLTDAIVKGDGGVSYMATMQLIKIIQDCKYKAVVTPEELVKCWASKGTYSCTYTEANQLAYQLPQTCAISVQL